MYNVFMRVFLTVSSLFFVLLPANGQGWVGAVKVGAAYTSFLGDTGVENSDWAYTTGLAAGGTVGYRIDNNFLAQLDIMYVRMGATTNIDDDFLGALSGEFDISYLAFPLLLNYRIDMDGYLHPRLFAGPSLALKLEENATATLQGDDGSGLTVTQEISLFESIDIGGVLGAGVEIEVGGQRLFLETRYYVGLSDISVDSVDDADTVRNKGFMFLLGILF